MSSPMSPMYTPPNSPYHIQQSKNQEQRPRPLWFICRGNGLVTPLVAADELPADVCLQGVPKLMAMSQAHGMINLGEYPSTGAKYGLGPWNTARTSSSSDAQQRRMQPPSSGSLELVHQSRNSQGIFDYTVDRPHNTGSTLDIVERSNASKYTHSRSSGEPHEQPQSFQAQPYSPASIGPTRRPLPSTGKEPDQNRKVYCSYWIRNGECDYMQQGCLYRHEMPLDLETLKRIGFQKYPQWWINKQAQNQSTRRLAVAKIEKARKHLTQPLPPIGSEWKARQASPEPVSSVVQTSMPFPLQASPPAAISGKNAGGLSASIHAQPSSRSTSHQSSRELETGDPEVPLIDFDPMIPTPSFKDTTQGSKSYKHIDAHASLHGPFITDDTPLSPSQIHPPRFLNRVEDCSGSEEGDEATDLDSGSASAPDSSKQEGSNSVYAGSLPSQHRAFHFQKSSNHRLKSSLAAASDGIKPRHPKQKSKKKG